MGLALQRIECLKSKEKSNRINTNSAPNIFYLVPTFSMNQKSHYFYLFVNNF